MSSPSSHSDKGFTLIEMLVVISIFLIMTGVILANFPAFRDKAGLDLIAQEIATTIRQAQVYGIGTREAGTAQQFTSYGIYFNLADTTNLGKKVFYLYADNKDNIIPGSIIGKYDDTDTITEKFAITGAAEIFDLQGCNSTASPPCSSLTSQSLNIFFQRFYPEATLPSGYSYVKIMIQSTRDASRKKEIQVWTTGQIVVANG